MRKRTQAREVALQVLYMIEMRDRKEILDSLHSVLSALTDDPDAQAYARRLVEGVTGRQDEIDERIAAAAQHWDVKRMATVDRNVLRIGVYEMLFNEDIPPKVAINEAIELAKRFGTEQSGVFVNGVLDQILNRHRAECADAGDAQEEAKSTRETSGDEYDDLAL